MAQETVREELGISTKNCTVEKDGHVLIVTLNRPEAKNALSSQMILGMYNAWRLLDSDPELRVAVLTGKGDTFCSGMDLKSGTAGDADAAMMQEKMKEIPDLHWQALLRHHQPLKPIVMAVEGYALAGGTEILQGTDIRVAAEDAIFGVTECKRGLFPLGGSTIRLRRQIPYCLAAEILLLGRHITAQEALNWGLINRVVPKNTALEAALKIAHEIADENGPLSIQAITKSLRQNQQNLSEKEALANEEQLGWPVFASADAREGMKAFKEKRKPVFTGK
jgi:enoyl-CoA hydratase